MHAGVSTLVSDSDHSRFLEVPSLRSLGNSQGAESKCRTDRGLVRDQVERIQKLNELILSSGCKTPQQFQEWEKTRGVQHEYSAISTAFYNLGIHWGGPEVPVSQAPAKPEMDHRLLAQLAALTLP